MVFQFCDRCQMVQVLVYYRGLLLTLPHVCLIKYTLPIRMYRNSAIALVPILFHPFNVPDNHLTFTDTCVCVPKMRNNYPNSISDLHIQH